MEYSLSNLLDFRLADKAPFLGDVSERILPGKIKEAGLNIVRGEVLGAPLIAEASAAVELELVDVVEAGDHDIFLGGG
ncbi:flavin reductase [Aeropyrum camini]|uniref:flavin reductase n=1 Tax=Aeropyrum camini TaxID=229980 RepID=UPI0009E6FA54|nr:flavin reductase [Aeropyrum camini]